MRYDSRCVLRLVGSWAVAAAMAAILWSRSSVAWADPPSPVVIPAGLQRYASNVDPHEREQLYQQLRQQAKVVEAQSAVVKLVAKLVGPAVVHIAADAVKNQPGFQMGHGRHVEEAGSGVIILLHDKYYVLTNRHVIRDSTKDAIKLTLADGRVVQPERIWDDPDTDVAVLEIVAPDLVAAPVGDSNALEIGDFVMAVGSPFGLSHSFTYGIISAKGRRSLELGEAGTNGLRFQDFLQTDASINPGNSGGPLINLRGEVIGLNTAIASVSGGNERVGFAIPSAMFMNVARQLIEHGGVTRAFMGVSLDLKFNAAGAAALGLPRPMGARVTAVTRNSPAEAAQIKVDDIILEFDRTPIEDDAQLINIVSMTEVGKRVPVVVYRGGQTLQITIELTDSGKFLIPTPPAYGNQ